MSRLSVEISGNLLSETILDALAEEDSKNSFAKPESFKWYKYDVVDSKNIHLSCIAEAYDELKARWDMLSSTFDELDISALREKWIKFLFKQMGYDLEYQKSDIVADSGNKFYLSHRGWQGKYAPVIHTVLYNQDLDTKPQDGRHKYSPHDTLQRYLNQANKDLWGMVTNGKELRILRDFHHETRKGYVKFDLELIFEGRNYNDFRLLWRLIHPSRFIPDENEKSILEKLFEASKEAGVAIGEHLQKNVRLAIESLANGFLLKNPELIDKMVDNNEASLVFYQQILRVIYRILFLFYAEQRKLMPTHSALYAREYSLSSLRQKIESREPIDSSHTDLWEGLKVTFCMVYEGVEELGIPAFNGQLFDPHTIGLLDKHKCRNDKLLEAIWYMAFFEKEGVITRISYVELSVDEIGAIYESLLEYIPRVSSREEVFEDAVFGTRRNRERNIAPRTFFLDPRGTNRKTSGSYYTHPGLVNALIESALVPVLEDNLKNAGQNKDTQEKALLSLKVCDPACGSAAFLIAATEYLGERLAKIRIQSDYPSDADIRHARREALRHCIYGVDLNPMAVELAKVSLWLTAATSDQPLNFLDHKIKCGNSLIGATPELIEKGIPPKAYSPVEGDDKTIAKQRVKSAKDYYKRRKQDKHQLVMESIAAYGSPQVVKYKDLSEAFAENTSKGIKEIKEEYIKSRRDDEFIREKFIADYWTSAFFWQHDDQQKEYPNPYVLDHMLKDKTIDVKQEVKDKVHQLAEENKFFHWHLEFPEVFAKGGFDCVLGNPPWEHCEMKEREFFASCRPDIINVNTGIQRKKKIEFLQKEDPILYSNFIAAKRKFDLHSHFFSGSGKYPLCGLGRINLYAIFSEMVRSIINSRGNVGYIVPTGIATDNTTKYYFQDILNTKSLVQLCDFWNRWGIFQGVQPKIKFCLLTLSNSINEMFKVMAQLEKIEQLKDQRRKYVLNLEDIKRINPNTFNCPIFSSFYDAEIIKLIYKRFSVLQKENDSNGNPWGITFRQGLFNMTSDSHLFYSREQLEKENFELINNTFVKDSNVFLPLYEAKMIYQYNHRAATFADVSLDVRFRIHAWASKSELKDLENPNYSIISRYWINEKMVNNLIRSGIPFMGFRNAISTVADARSLISAILPHVGVGNSMPLIEFTNETTPYFIVLSVFNSFIMDYIVRQKASGGNLNFYIVKQLPFPSPDFFKQNTPWMKKKTILNWVLPYVLELTYTAWDIEYFAKNLSCFHAPFKWNEKRRFFLQCELDAAYFHLYEIKRRDVEYIMDSFPIVKRRDIEQYNEYRTKQAILMIYDEMEEAIKTGKSYKTRLNPSPADPQLADKNKKRNRN